MKSTLLFSIRITASPLIAIPCKTKTFQRDRIPLVLFNIINLVWFIIKNYSTKVDSVFKILKILCFSLNLRELFLIKYYLQQPLKVHGQTTNLRLFYN